MTRDSRKNHSDFAWIVHVTLLVPEDPKNLMQKVLMCDLVYYVHSHDNWIV